MGHTSLKMKDSIYFSFTEKTKDISPPLRYVNFFKNLYSYSWKIFIMLAIKMTCYISRFIIFYAIKMFIKSILQTSGGTSYVLHVAHPAGDDVYDIFSITIEKRLIFFSPISRIRTNHITSNDVPRARATSATTTMAALAVQPCEGQRITHSGCSSWNNIDTFPKKISTYLILRKDGQISMNNIFYVFKFWTERSSSSSRRVSLFLLKLFF